VNRSVLRLVAEAFCDWLDRRRPPSGKPVVHDLRANWVVLITAIPAGGGPPADPARLEEGTVRDLLEWLFKGLHDAHSGDVGWSLASHALRLLALEAAPDVLAAILAPSRSLVSGDAK
jgi:hypothetical protein